MSYFEEDEAEYRGSDDESETDDGEEYESKKNRKRFGGTSDDEEEDVNLKGGDGDENEDNIPEDEIDIDDEDGMHDIDDLEKDPEQEDGTESKTEPAKQSSKRQKSKKSAIVDDDDDDDDEYEDDDDDPEQYLQKFDDSLNKNYILANHPECISHNYKEVLSMCKVIRDANGIVVDDLHKTISHLTKYERAKIVGLRAKQLNSGASPFIKIDESIIDGYVIAEMELKEKKIPFIIKRPMPNGGSEYWHLKDLEDVLF